MVREGLGLTVVFGRSHGVDVGFAAIIGEEDASERAKVLLPAYVDDRLLSASVELVEEEVFLVCEVTKVFFVCVLDVTVFVLNFEITLLVLGEEGLAFEIAWAISVGAFVAFDGINDILHECGSLHDRFVVAFDGVCSPLHGGFIFGLEANAHEKIPKARFAPAFR